MGRRKTTFEFIQEAQAVHGDLYDYSKVDYQSGKKKVLIIDPEYGEFWQAAGNHLTGQGNPKRGKLRGGKTRKKTTEQFIKEATKVHGGLYDYSKTEYQDSSTKVFIIDPDYGEFWQLPLAHLKGFGSFKRGVDKSKKSRIKSLDVFIKEAAEIHGDLYDYSKVEYINTHTKVLIIDPDYGEFWQTPRNHLSGQGNPKRGVIKSQKSQTDTTEDFVRKAIEIHDDLYDYSKVKYVDSYTKVLIIDPDYGEFWQAPNSHLQGVGSPNRGIESARKLRLKTREKFIKDANLIHGDLYDYSKVEYIGAKREVVIICSKHGEFAQTPNSHLRGSGCAKCVGRNRTTDEFVVQARKVHGGLYDYSQVEYKKAHKKILIIDPDYGEFWQAPNSHLKGVGNPARKGGVRITTDEFIKRAKAIHGDLYDYSKVRYKGAFEKVLINDLEYGEFWQEANQHLQGSGNPQRSGNVKLDRNEFIKRAKAIHGGFYNYSKVEYVNIDTPVVIIDIDYGEFVQRPEVHLRGAGHPSRSHYGFDSQKPAILYYLRINNGEAYKIGITGNSLVERFGSDMQHINVVKIWEYKVGEGAYIREQEILLKYAEFKYTGDYLLKSGNTELFFKDVLGLDV